MQHSSGDQPQESVTIDTDIATEGALERYRIDGAPRGSAVSATTHALREAILDGALATGTWLREVSLASTLGVSRTPVREALARLEEEGLVVRESGAGARVTDVTLDDMSVIYQVRGSLESLAARFAATRITSDQLAKLHGLQDSMREAIAANDAESFAQANVIFHRQLAVVADNAYIARLLGPVEVALRRFGAKSLSTERMPQVLAEHEAILLAFTNGDPEAAASAAASHAESARTSTLERMIRQVR